jgi:hypothetical protein
LGRGLSPLILGKIIAKTADLGSKKAGLRSDFWRNCMVLKKISIGKRPFFRVCYVSRKITAVYGKTHIKYVGKLTESSLHKALSNRHQMDIDIECYVSNTQTHKLEVYILGIFSFTLLEF